MGKSKRRGASPVLLFRHYSARSLAETREALRDRGLFAVWSEEHDAAFEKRLQRAGFRCERQRPGGKGGRRHVIYLASRE